MVGPVRGLCVQALAVSLVAWVQILEPMVQRENKLRSFLSLVIQVLLHTLAALEHACILEMSLKKDITGEMS